MRRIAHHLCSGRSFALAAFLCVAAIAASAQDWHAVAIGNPAPGSERADVDARLAADGLERLGTVVIDRLENAEPAEMAATIAALSSARQAVLFFSGPLALGVDGDILFGSGGDAPVFARQLSLGNITHRLADGGTRELVAVIEDCPAGTDGQPGALSGLSQLPEAPFDVLLVLSASPDGICEGPTPRVSDLLGEAKGPATSLEGFEFALKGATLLRLRPPPGMRPRAPTSQKAPPDFGPMTLALGSARPDDLVAAPPVLGLGFGQPETTGQDAGAAPAGQARVIRVGIRPDDPIIKERPGRRRPSILIGLLPEEHDAANTPEPPPAPELPAAPAYDDRRARDTLRKGNPEAFAILLNRGDLDPPDPDRVAAALQTELKAMGCYRSVVDNDWGPGSQRGLTAYAKERTVEVASIAPDLRPTFALWREIISHDPVTCPEPVQVSAPPPASKPAATRSKPAASAKPAPAYQAPAKKAAPAPPKPSIRKGLSGNIGIR